MSICKHVWAVAVRYRRVKQHEPFVGAKCLLKSRCGIANEQGIGESARVGCEPQKPQRQSHLCELYVQ